MASNKARDTDEGKEGHGAQRKQKQDPGWAWFVLLGTTLMIAIQNGFARCMGLFLIEFLDIYHEGRFMTGWVISVYFFFYTLIALIMGMTGDLLRWSNQVFVFTVLCVLGMLASAYVHSFHALFFLFSVCCGIGRAGFIPANVILQKAFMFRRGIASGIAFSGGSIAMMTFPFLIELLVNTFGGRGMMVLFAGILAQQFIAVFIFRVGEAELHHKRKMLAIATKPCKLVIYDNQIETNTIETNEENQGVYYVSKSEVVYELGSANTFGEVAKTPTEDEIYYVGAKRKKEQSIDNKAKPHPTLENGVNSSSTGDTEVADPGEVGDRSCIKKCLKHSLCQRKLFTYLIYWIFLCTGKHTYAQFIPIFSKESGLTITQISAILTVNGICDFAGRLIWGFISDIKCVNNRHVFAGTAAVGGVASILTGLVPRPPFWLMMTFMAVNGLFFEPFNMFMNIVTLEAAGTEKHVGRVTSLSGSLFGLGGFLAAVIAGPIREATGSYNFVIQLAGILNLIGGFIYLVIGQRLHCTKCVCCHRKRSYDFGTRTTAGDDNRF